MSNVFVSRYEWTQVNFTTLEEHNESFLVVWASPSARDALIARLGFGEIVETAFIDEIKMDASLKANWIRNACKSGAILGIGL